MQLTEAADIIQKRMNCRNANNEVCKITKCKDCSNYLDIEEAYTADEVAVKAIKYCIVRGVSLITDRDAEIALGVLDEYCVENKRNNCEGCTFALPEDKCRLRSEG